MKLTYLNIFLKGKTCKSIYYRSFLLYSLALLTIAFLWSASKPAANTEDIVLKAEKLLFTPSGYYIADVIDERKERTAIAWIVPAPGASKQSAGFQKLDLKGGGLTGLKQFIGQSIPSNKKLRPVIIRLKECRMTETAGAQGRVDGKVALNMAFYLKRNGEEVHILDYEGGAKYGRMSSQQGVIEPVLRQSLSNALKYLNTWMEQQTDTNEKLATGIKVIFSEPEQIQTRDTVFYSPRRPLIWSDFKAIPNGKSQFAASVFPGFGYKGKTDVINGVIHLNLTMQVFMLQQGSWVKDAARNNYSLNHEQKHFDIVKVVAERFKKKIIPDSLTIEDYNSIIQYQYIESFREMNRMQEQYDGETQHGINKEAQARWDKIIDIELKNLGVKK